MAKNKADFSRERMIETFMGEAEPDEAQKEKKNSKLTIDVKEQRSVKKQLLLTPTLFKRLEREAKRKNTSVNNLINLILEAYLDQ